MLDQVYLLIQDQFHPPSFLGGHQKVSYCHIARSVCRRAERNVSKLKSIYNFQDEILIYLNRLSDYIFVIARKFSIDLEIEEIPWET